MLFKKCPALVKCLHKIFLKIWKTRDVPADWAVAYIALLAKSANLACPAEFRPIAVTNTAGKILFSIISDRLQSYLVDNEYIKRKVQKGFLAGVAGCVEHTFALWEALRNAKENQRAFVTTWIDLANAYGSVRHNLIQFALNWYHVPPFIQKLIFNYYEQLCAMIVTEDWKTGFFLFDIGCFQGCVLSTILFDCVFNMLLDFLQPLERYGYKFKGPDIKNFSKAYADDLAISTSRPRDNQIVLNHMVKWLDWTVTMKAKPKKCVSLGYRQFKRGSVSAYTPLSENIYAPFDPLLEISGQPVRFIVNEAEKDPLKSTHFKFLGRWISWLLENEQSLVKTNILELFKDLMRTLDKCPVSGLIKCWLYQHYILAMLSWPFLVHDFALSFTKDELDPIATRYLKTWARIFRHADVGLLYRSRDRFGLAMTPPSAHFKKMQVVKCLLVKGAQDQDLQLLYELRATKERAFLKRERRVWRGSQLTTKVEAMVHHKTLFAGQSDRVGLGAGKYKPVLSPAEHRKACASAVMTLEDEAHWKHAHTLPLQGVWTHWFEYTHPLDFSWKTLIWGPGRALVSFLLNASINSLPTPDMRKMMGYTPTARCPLCRYRQCTLFHILVGCKVALCSGRYTWRHDSVLLTLMEMLQEHLDRQNSTKIAPSLPPDISKSFVKKTKKKKKKPAGQPPNTHLLSRANDWEMMVDFNHDRLVFPKFICSSDERPDVVIFSKQYRRVILIELTCPAEESIPAKHIEKKARYLELVERIRQLGWSAQIFAVEAGARGFVARSMNKCLRELGFTPGQASKTCKTVSFIAAKCSHTIWVLHKQRNWSKRQLLSPASVADLKTSV